MSLKDVFTETTSSGAAAPMASERSVSAADSTVTTLSKHGLRLGGVSHLALTSGDMARTVDFYQGGLGFPLVKTMALPDGGQHFFFDVGNGDCLAFFWFGNSRPAAPGVAAPAFIGDVSAIGSLHHVAFKVDLEQFHEWRALLESRGVKHKWFAHDLDGSMGKDVGDDTFALSIYLLDPDGVTIEFCAWMPAYDRIGNDDVPVSVPHPL